MQIVLLLLVVVAIAGSLFLGFGDVQPEPAVVEKPITLQPIQ